MQGAGRVGLRAESPPGVGASAAVSGALPVGHGRGSAVRGGVRCLVSPLWYSPQRREATPNAFQPRIAHVSPRSPRVSVDVWATLADFCNILTAVNQSEVPLYKDPDDDLALLSLEEDRLLSGFVPLLVAPQEPCYVERTSDKVSSRPNIPPRFLQTFILGKFSVQTEHD